MDVRVTEARVESLLSLLSWSYAECGCGSGQQLDDVAMARLNTLTETAKSYLISLRVWSDRGKAAVHQHGRTGEVARLRRREENDHLGDLARVRGPAQRRRGAQLLQPVAERAGGTVGAGGPGCDGVGANPVGAERRRPGPGERFECRLRGRGDRREGDADRRAH